MSSIKKINDAHARRETFIEFHGKSRLLEIKLLYQMEEANDFESLGFESFKVFCEAPVNSGGLGISRQWASQIVSTYKKYVLELGMPEHQFVLAPVRKLYFLKDRATKDNLNDLLLLAQNNTLQDLEKLKKGINEADCEHDWETKLHCVRCGTWSHEQTE